MQDYLVHRRGDNNVRNMSAMRKDSCLCENKIETKFRYKLYLSYKIMYFWFKIPLTTLLPKQYIIFSVFENYVSFLTQISQN